jgi:hypothetical protein
MSGWTNEWVDRGVTGKREAMLHRQGVKTLQPASLSRFGMKLKATVAGVFSSLPPSSPWLCSLPFSLPRPFSDLLPSARPPIYPPSSSRFSVLSLLLMLALSLSLGGCGLLNGGPANTVVEQAVAQKLMATQALLRTQLPGDVEATNTFEVGRVKVTATRRVSLDDQAAVEVEGTYTLKGGNLTRAQRQQLRPFDLYLQRGETQDQWLLLEPKANGGYNRRQVSSAPPR